ncbi:nitrogen fixation protein NifX [Corallincola luteus]|uniref:Nitrogen fixation protein NifX n=2 Tax=Corallincola TaxID=1775176 RepID=A0A368NRS0_9GAMM|nr:MULTISPECIES: NifB/NifX family molybdenum-iron cluster-binding protein [Corallincola]RCU52515.1 nitrogen fixation protein NifX [Corallincola holothuriorum]TCI02403.1 nitrogen fixation protein NifX [Corallincola luteus]
MNQPERVLHVVEDAHSPISQLRVAFATGDKETVDQHFGSARSFMIYAINEDDFHLVEAVEFKHAAQGHDDGKLQPRINALSGCAAVHFIACGPPAIRQLLNQGVQPLKLEEGSCIRGLLEEIQQQMIAEPESWPAKALLKKRQSQVDELERLVGLLDEDW